MSLSPTIPLRTAYLCLTCQLINQGARQGKCHSCGSETIYPVSTLLAAYVKGEPPRQGSLRHPPRLAVLNPEMTLRQRKLEASGKE
jgi:hypothetical protein